MSHIFDTGFLSTNNFNDFDQLAGVAASVWGQRYRKLGKGSEFGFDRQLNLPTAQLTHIDWESGMRSEYRVLFGEFPSETLKRTS